MNTGIKGKTVLITGASRNMGRVASLTFAREGANLAICTSAKMKELNQVADEAREILKTQVFQTVIPRNVRLSESPSHGKPALLYAVSSRGAQSYLELAREMVNRWNGRTNP